MHLRKAAEDVSVLKMRCSINADNGGKGAYPIGVHPPISPRTMQPKSGVRLHKLERKHGKRDFKPTGISRSYCFA